VTELAAGPRPALLPQHPPRAVSARELAARLLLLEEQDAGAVAGELHDGVIQGLVATRYLVDLMVAGLRRADRAPALADLLGLQAAAQEALRSGRVVLSQVQSRCSDGRGLPGAIEAVAAAARRAGLSVDLAIATLPDRLESVTCLVAHRLTRAATADALARGAGAVRLRVGTTDTGLEVDADDDGSVPVAVPSSTPTGAALDRWRERAALVGGHVDVAVAATGLRVRVWLPDAELAAVAQSGRAPTATAGRPVTARPTTAPPPRGAWR